MATAFICERMQNLKVNSNGNSVEPKFYHYCYVCNTQLNSCKQALLHCSGKRHRKKLQFLQSRKHPVGQLPTGAPIGAPPPPVNPVSSSTCDPPSCYPIYPHVNSLPTLPAGPQFTPEPRNMNPPMGGASGSSAPPGCPSFYPHTTVLSPATVAGTDQWLHPVPMFQSGGSIQVGAPPGPPMGPLPIQMGPYHPQQPIGMGQGFSSVSNSPLVLTDVSGSSYSEGTRSAVISPSDTSSMSSDPSVRTRSFKCHVCQRHFGNLTQLHCHLQAARHYKNDGQQFYVNHSEATLRKTVDSSESDSTSSVYYCSACNIAVNSRAQMDSHNTGYKHKQRVAAQQRKHSRSSSTSSEPTGEIVVDAGYASGSCDDAIVILHPTPERPAARYRCQVCNTFMNSLAQAQQHLTSQKHQLRLSGRPPFRRKSSNSFKRKQQNQSTASHTSSQEAATNNLSQSDDVDDCESPETPSPEPETDSTLTVRQAEV